MKKLITLMIVLVVLSPASLSFAQRITQPISPVLKQEIIREFKFKKTIGITIPVLKRDVFLKRFGPNPNIPKTNQAVVQLAKFLYSPAGRAQIKETCGETVYGNLFAALQNPDISDAARDEVDKAAGSATPTFNKTYTEGHFKFSYTDNNTDPNHNVTENEIKATAQVLNGAWNNFTTNFKKPKHYIVSGIEPVGGGGYEKLELIDVNVYYLGPDLRGSTSSFSDNIELNSQTAVRDPCGRQTTPPHELFHRVQYSYGFQTGTPLMKWATEGTAAWSEKFCAPNIGTWLIRMNEGLIVPNRGLTTERAYDACLFWVYLGQQGKGEKECIKQVWETYETNGSDMIKAVESVIKSRVPYGPDFIPFAGWWMIANFLKDMTNAPPAFEYVEDELSGTCGGNTYGPLAHVPRIQKNISTPTSFVDQGSAKPYGANYHVYNLAKSPMVVDVTVTGQGTFGFALVEIRGNQWVNYVHTPTGGYSSFSQQADSKTGAYLDQIALMVMGNPNGGSYSINIRAYKPLEKAILPSFKDIIKKKPTLK